MSSSSSSPRWIYDLFINFRGEDTRTNFVSHLYAALSNAGINTFLDDEKLVKGGKLKPELERAIEVSNISIVVFSQTYTESSWCLDELVQIMECQRTYGQVVIPLFYDVDPAVVRHQKGAFGKALEVTAIKRYSDRGMRKEDLLSKWRSALIEAANLSGWDADKFRDEAELVKQIVEDVLKKLDITLLSTTDFPVGLDARAQKVIDFIDNQSSKVCVVGIWGMGGSGKTTTAKAIYNRIHRKFVESSFIESIREVCENDKRGIIYLQQQLLSDVLKTNEKIYSIASGITKIKTRLSGKKALIVLDDVTESKQLKALCGDRTWFGIESVLIITTRDKRLLREVDHVCTMMEMDENESLELFSWHAFRQPNPIEDFGELSTKIVAYCGGLPLALEILGSYLFDSTEQDWKYALSKLERIPNDQVQEKLRISYDALKYDTERDIFLDICCFFIGKDRAYVTEILNGCRLYAGDGIKILIERSLLKVGKNNKLGMHGLLREMGREIVRESSPKEPEKHSRLWFHEDVLHVLTENIGTKTVEGLSLNLQRTGRVSFSTSAFQEMKKLRLLQLDRADLTGDFGYLSKQLRWVNWQRCAFKYMPDDFYQGNLVVLELKYSNVTQVWKEVKLLEKLKILNLSHSMYLKNTPDFSKLPNLEKLIMKDCPSLSEVHPSIGDLKNLLLINLRDCTSLGNLPREIYQLKYVTTLILSGCSKIDKLEEDIEQMESLTTLIAENTAVEQVPFSIVRSKSIGYISLCGYKGLSRDVFPSLIWSWMSPTMNSLPLIPTFRGISRLQLGLENNNMGLGNPLTKLSNLSTLRSVQVQFYSEVQLTRELRRFLFDLYDANFSKMETSHTSQISDLSLKTLLIGMGSYHLVINTLDRSISQGLTTNDSNASFFPGDNYPSWLAYTCEGPSVSFQVPKDSNCRMKGMVVCVVYSSTPENMANECLSSVLVINHTKLISHIYKRDTVMSFNDDDWQGVISNFGVGDLVEILVAFGYGLTIMETAVYLIYGQSAAMEIETSITMEVEPSTHVEMEPLPEVNVQPSPNVKTEPSPEEEVQPSPNVKMVPSLVVKKEPLPKSTTMEIEPSISMEVEPSTHIEMEPLPEVNVLPSPNVKTEPSPEEEVQPSPNVKIVSSLVVKKEPLPKSNKKIFTRFAKRVGECLCLNQNRGLNKF